MRTHYCGAGLNVWTGLKWCHEAAPFRSCNEAQIEAPHLVVLDGVLGSEPFIMMNPVLETRISTTKFLRLQPSFPSFPSLSIIYYRLLLLQLQSPSSFSPLSPSPSFPLSFPSDLAYYYPHCLRRRRPALLHEM